MRLGEIAIAGIIGLFACVGLIWAGIAFAGFAIMTALTPQLELAGAAAVTAAILLAGPILVVLLAGRRKTGENKRGADNILSAIAQIAQERPFVAMVGAALFGAAEVLLKQRKKKK